MLLIIPNKKYFLDISLPSIFRAITFDDFSKISYSFPYHFSNVKLCANSGKFQLMVRPVLAAQGDNGSVIIMPQHGCLRDLFGN